MTDNEFTRVCSLLRGAFPRITLFSSPESSNVLFNALNRFDYRDVWSGVQDCVENSQYPPSIREILDSVERAESNRHQDERENARRTWNEAVHCEKCNDAGYVNIKRADGTESIRPCTCQAARDKFPWAFKTDEELQKAVEDQRRKGKNPPSGRPGMPSKWFEEKCGKIVEMTPGRRPQVFTKGRKDEQTV